MTRDELLEAIAVHFSGDTDAEGQHLLQFIHDFVTDVPEEWVEGHALTAAHNLVAYAQDLLAAVEKVIPSAPKRYLVSVPFSLHVWITANSRDAITDETVEDALMEQHGKYAQVDVRNGGGSWDVLDEEDA